MTVTRTNLETLNPHALNDDGLGRLGTLVAQPNVDEHHD